MAAKLEKLSKLEKAGKIHKLDPVTFFVDRRFNVTNFGPTAAKIEHRQILSHYVIASNEAERRIWSQLSNSMSSYGIEIEVYGATYNEQGLFVHHYNSKIRTVACFGGKPIYYGTKDAIANFDSIKADYGAPGYKESNTRLFINKIIVHPYEQIHQGGANPGKKSEGPEIVNLAPGIWARDTPLKIGYGDLKAGEDPMKNNNCAFRAIYSQVAKNRQKWFKQQFPLKTIRKEFGLPPNCKISPDELFMICDAKGVELTIIVVRGMDPETAEISIKSTQATGHVEPMIRVILHADTEHYYCPATGKSPDNHTTDCGHMVNYRQGVYTKVVLFGAGGPKAYGALLQAPDGQIIPKNRIKGIKEDAFTFYVTDDGSDKRTIDGDNIKFSKKAEAITRLIHKAVRTPGAYISTFYRQSFKSYGFIPQGHERVTNDAGQIKRAEPWTQCITNVRRDVLKEVASRRRLLTSEEVKYLGLNEYDASRILVPNGWNWDGALFRLI